MLSIIKETSNTSISACDTPNKFGQGDIVEVRGSSGVYSDWFGEKVDHVSGIVMTSLGPREPNTYVVVPDGPLFAEIGGKRMVPRLYISGDRLSKVPEQVNPDFVK